jgi:hypothetical protein
VTCHTASPSWRLAPQVQAHLVCLTSRICMLHERVQLNQDQPFELPPHPHPHHPHHPTPTPPPPHHPPVLFRHPASALAPCGNVCHTHHNMGILCHTSSLSGFGHIVFRLAQECHHGCCFWPGRIRQASAAVRLCALSARAGGGTISSGNTGKEGYLSMIGASMVLTDATKGITIKQPVLLIIHNSLVTTSADAAAVQTVLAGMFPCSSHWLHWCMAQPQSGQCSLLCLGCKCSQICRSQ